MSTTPENARNEQLRQILEQMKEEGKDPFDREHVEKIPGNKPVTVENADWYVLENQWPYTGSENHLVIISKRSVQNIAELNPSEYASYLEIIQRLVKENNIVGGAACMRFGDAAKSGATVNRIHGHLLSPKNEEVVTFFIGKRKSKTS